MIVFLKRTHDFLGKHNRFIISFLTLFLLPPLLYSISMSAVREKIEEEYIRIPQFICILVSALAIFSVFRTTIIYDEHLRNDFWAYNENPEKKGHLSYVLHQKVFLFRLLILAIPFLLFPLSVTCVSLAEMYNVDSFLKKLPFVLLLYVFLACVSVLSYLSAIANWHTEGRKSVYRTKDFIKGFLLILGIYIVLTAVVYTLFVSLLLPFFGVLGLIFIKLGGWLPAAVGCIAIVVFLCRLLSSLRKRKSLITEMSRVFRNEGIEISPVQHPYRSLLFVRREESFRFTCSGTTYSCIFLPASGRSTPTYLYGDGTVVFVHTVRFFKITLFEFRSRRKFGFTAEGKKIILLNPVPKHIYTTGEGRRVELDNGDFVGEYRIYTGTGFLNALQRRVLDRKN